MYHSLTIGTKNTYDDWHLVPKSRPTVSAAQPKLVYDDIPGGNGSLDLSEAVTGSVVYNDRAGSFEFLVLNDYGEWQDRYSEIMNYLQGQRLKMVLEDDPDYYYYGRFAVNEWKSEKNWSTITIDYRVGPFKYKKDPTTMIANIVGSTYVTLPDIIIPVVPEITTTEAMTLHKGSRNYPFVAGVTRSVVQIKPGERVQFASTNSGSYTTPQYNLLPSVYYDELEKGTAAWTRGGITYTLNSNGTVICDGTATSTSWYSFTGTYLTDKIPPLILDPDETYTLSGAPVNASASTFMMRVRLWTKDHTPGVDAADRSYNAFNGDAGKVVFTGYKYAEVYISVQAGASFPTGSTGKTFNPQLEVGSTKHAYESTHNTAAKAIIKYNGGSL